MASFHQRTILIALIFMISTTISIAYRDLSEEDGSEDVYDGDDWDPENGDGDTDGDWGNGDGDNSEIGRYLRDLCSETKKSKQCWKIIKPEINRFTDTNSRNVAGVVIDHDINRDLDIVKTNLYSDDDGKFSSAIDDVKEELKQCKKEFDKESEDPAHIRNRNKEFRRYLEILRVATKRSGRDDDGWRK